MQCGEAVFPESWFIEQVLLVFLFRTGKLVRTNFVVVSATLSGPEDPRHAPESVSEEGPHAFLELVRHCVALSVRHAKNSLLESLFGSASGPRLHLKTHVVRTAATLRVTAFAEFCCCVHAKYSELGASIAFPSVDCRKR